MSDTINQQPVGEPLSIRDLTEMLVKHYDLHEGRYDLLIEFSIGIGAVGPSQDKVTPGAMIGVQRFSLAKTLANSPSSVDAALVNPPTKAKKKGRANVPA